MKCPSCVRSTARKTARAVVIAVVVPTALCLISVLCLFMGGGDVKSC